MREIDKKQVTTWFGKRLSVVAACVLLPLAALADEFVVRDMRVEGLQRISEGTVFNYLPINIGDTVDDVRIRKPFARSIIRASSWILNFAVMVILLSSQ
jgi:outer membrane protein assembly factor BamA